MKKNAVLIFDKKYGGKRMTRDKWEREPSALEDAIIDIAIEMSAKNFSEIARRAWPERGEAAAIRKYQHMTQKEGKNKRQYLRVEDARRIAVGLEIELTKLITMAELRVEGRSVEKAPSDKKVAP